MPAQPFLAGLYGSAHANRADTAAGDILQMLGIAGTHEQRRRIAERIEVALDLAHMDGHRQAKRELNEAYRAVCQRERV